VLNKSPFQVIIPPAGGGGFVQECFDVYDDPADATPCPDTDPYDFTPNYGPQPNPHILAYVYLSCDTDILVTSDDFDIYKGIACSAPWREAYAGVYAGQNPAFNNIAVPPTDADMFSGWQLSGTSGAAPAQLKQAGGSCYGSGDGNGPTTGWITKTGINYLLNGVAKQKGGYWFVIWAQSEQHSINVGESCYPCTVWSSCGIRNCDAIEINPVTFSCFDTCPTVDPPAIIDSPCQGSFWGPYTVFPDGSGYYYSPYPWIQDSLMVFVGGTLQIPINIDVALQRFQLVADPTPMDVQIEIQLPYDWVGPP